MIKFELVKLTKARKCWLCGEQICKNEGCYTKNYGSVENPIWISIHKIHINRDTL